MTTQRQHDNAQSIRPASPGAPDPAESRERLAASRQEFDRALASADSILDRLRQGDSETFLDQVRQSGGE